MTTVEATTSESGAIFLHFEADAPGRGNRWMIEIDGEDFSEILIAMMKADPFATVGAFDDASGPID
ncbi:hypothetical protein X770_10185 [Mesorhizobium sp. LSJC269B00]|uniref:hypothetical protein n=1 Tax=Mesorhizobium sp. LSJC269B00 TaxID=1287326 RepID=UPI0003CEDF72|nr:hypothetical protein [Mesorhizobium sp. LSJC269B00]ESW91102.1 hypothetical protein X770_10185 [Mesorhizobium sp. LSJC269B00]